MLGKIAAFELKMYFVPGSYALILASILTRIAGGSDLFNATIQGSDLTQSFIFVMASYVLGQLIQSVGHGLKILGKSYGPEQQLKTRYWNGCYPSELALHRSVSVLGESNRSKVISALLKADHLETSQVGQFDQPPTADSRELSQAIFNRLLSRVSEKEESPIKTAEAAYQMLRGFFFVSWLAFVAALILASTTKASRYLETENQWLATLSWPGLLAFTLFTGFAWLVFRYRCRGAGEGLAKRVLLSALDP